MWPDNLGVLLAVVKGSAHMLASSGAAANVLCCTMK